MHVNYFGVFLAALVPVAVGFLWYGPWFGKEWMRLMGWENLSPAALADGKRKMPMNAAIQIAGAFLLSWVLAHFILFSHGWLGVPNWLAGIVTAFAAWIGFIVPVTIGTVLWEGKPWKYWFLLAGNWLTSLLLMGLVLGFLI